MSALSRQQMKMWQDGWSRSQPCPGWSQTSPVVLSLSPQELSCAAPALPGLQMLWEVGKGVAGLGGWFWGGFLSLHTIPLVFPHLKRFLLVTQGHASDGCWQVWLFLSLVVQASSASSILCSHKCHQCHICQLSLLYLPSSQCMGNCAYTHMGHTGEHLFSTFPELNFPFL